MIAKSQKQTPIAGVVVLQLANALHAEDVYVQGGLDIFQKSCDITSTNC